MNVEHANHFKAWKALRKPEMMNDVENEICICYKVPLRVQERKCQTGEEKCNESVQQWDSDTYGQSYTSV